MSFNQDFLAHHGIKGQKWGVRRTPEQLGHAQGETKSNSFISRTKNGVEVHIDEHQSGKIGWFIRNKAPSLKTNMDFDIKVSGEKVGNLYLDKISDSELNVNWISVKKKEQGKGYAQAVMNGTIDYAKKHGYKELSLEVPDDSKDARHIYEKIGFKVEHDTELEDLGLTKMRLTL